jgi:hypothetical protein
MIRSFDPSPPPVNLEFCLGRMLVPAISPAGDETGGEGSNGFRRFRFELTQAAAKRTRWERAASNAVNG